MRARVRLSDVRAGAPRQTPLAPDHLLLLRCPAEDRVIGTEHTIDRPVIRKRDYGRSSLVVVQSATALFEKHSQQPGRGRFAMRKVILAATLTAVALPISTPALADPPSWAPAHGRRAHDAQRDYNDDGYRRLGRDDQIWRGNDGRYYCRRSNGTTGLVVGAAIGGLIGNQVAGRGDRTLGTILGAAGGGLLGRQIDRGNVHCH